jgi:large subunit ribosomal protein L13
VRTYQPRKGEVERRWWLVDAEGQTLGRLASQVAVLLRGKHKPQYAPFLDVGDFVVVVNASRVRLTGKKLDQKFLYRHSGYPGGLKAVRYRELLARRPEEAVRRAVKGMLPKGPLGRKLLGKLKVYPGPDHPHRAQRPEALVLGGE